MYKKKLQRLGVACLAAAMVLTTVSFPSVVKAEEGTSTQTDEKTTTELEKGKVLVQVDHNVLKANAMCNSEMNPAISWDRASGFTKNIDGQAEYAFDGDESLGTNSEKITGGMWHSRYGYTANTGGCVAGTNTDYSATVRGNEETINNPNRPWIGSGFGRKIMLKKVTYMGRYTNTNISNNIADYELYYADMDNPNEEPTASDWHLGKTGTLEATSEASDIVLDTAVEATHFKLVGKTAYDGSRNKVGNDQLVCAREIKAYELKDIDINLTAPTSADFENVEATTSEVTTEAGVEDVSDDPVTLTNATMETNVLQMSSPITIPHVADNKLDVYGTDGRDDSVLIQLSVKFKNGFPASGDKVLFAKGGAYRIVMNGSTIKFWVYCGNIANSNVRWKEIDYQISNTRSFVNKNIVITALYDGTTRTRIWVNGVEGTNNNKNNSENLGGEVTRDTSPVTIGNSAITDGTIRTLTMYTKLGSAITNNQTDYTSMMAAVNAGGNATKVLDIRGVPAQKAAYTVSTNWTTESNADPETYVSKNTYTETVTVTPAENASIVTAPEAVTVDIDGSDTHNKVVPVSEESTLGDRTATVKYVFEDMLRGGSLRMIKADGTTDYTKTSMRFGYDFQLPTDTAFASCEWYYGTNADNLNQILAPGANTNKIENPTTAKQDYIRSNIVFTNIAKANFDKTIYARVLVNYTNGGKTYSKMGAYADQNSVNSVIEKINQKGSATEKKYVNKLTGAN